jgi:DNA recombination-mediator protein A
MSYQNLSPQELLGPLNEVEQKNVPKTLYVAGDTGILRERARVAIVGSRKASPEGLRRASKLAGLLADRGIVIVSGLAEGIDTAAHTAAIHCGGRTIAVLGTPLDQVFPRQNAALQDQIMREHLAVSQFECERQELGAIRCSHGRSPQVWVAESYAAFWNLRPNITPLELASAVRRSEHMDCSKCNLASPSGSTTPATLDGSPVR